MIMRWTSEAPSSSSFTRRSRNQRSSGISCDRPIAEHLHAEGTASVIGAALEIEREIGRAHGPDLEGLEQRRIEVTRRNRSRLVGG
jgi:hypothetical protein